MAGVRGRSGGRNAKTVQQHLVQNTFQPVRHAGFTNPDPPKGTPVPPKDLAGDALAEWTRMVERLTLSGSLSTIDDAAIYQYCRLFAETEELTEEKSEAKASLRIMEENIGDLEAGDRVAMFQEIGKLRHDIKGYNAQIRSGRMGLRQYLVEFGLTPASRSRVKVTEEKQPANPLARFVKRAS